MFEDCRKIEIHKIQNHYHYYVLNGNYIPIQNKDNCSYISLKPKPQLKAKQTDKQQNINSSRKGLKLSKIIKELDTKPEIIHSPISLLRKYESPATSRISQSNKIQVPHPQFQLQQNVLEKNKILFYSLYNNTPQCQQYQTSSVQIETNKEEDNLYHIQKLGVKSKINSILTTQQAQWIQKSHCLQKKNTNHQQTSQILGSTKPAESKIQTCCTVEMLTSGKLTEKHKNDALQQSQNSKIEKSQLISISKSMSSIESQMKDKVKHEQHCEEDKYKNSNQISLIFSNIFSRQSNNHSSQKKLDARQNILKRLSLWQDSDRHTISSRLSRQYDFTQDFSIKVEQSFIQEFDIHKNLVILEQNKISKKDYIVSQAIEKNISLLISLKEFISKDTKLIVHQLQVYELIQNLYHSHSPPPILNNILALYKVQLKDSIHLLIKEPFTMPLQNKIKNMNAMQLQNLRKTLKQIARDILQLFQKYSFYPVQKITTHEFVFCLNQLKFHDLAIFQFAKKPFLPIQIVLAGLEI